MELRAKPREAVGTMAGEPWYNPMGFRCVVPRLPDDAAPDRNRTHGAPLRLTCAVETGMGCRGGGRYPKFKELPKERMSTEPVKAMTKEETRAWAAKQFPIEGAWLKDGKGAVEGFPRWHLASLGVWLSNPLTSCGATHTVGGGDARGESAGVVVHGAEQGRAPRPPGSQVCGERV